MTFTGVFPILPTPFREDETVDLDSFHKIVQFMGSIGVDGVTILGVLGEANRLIDAERRAIIQCAIEAAGGLPFVVGTSHSGTTATIQLSQMAGDLGAAGIMVTPHREAIPNEARIYDHFSTIGSEVSLPIILQDHPISTQVHMSLDLVLRMVEDIETVACIKQEAVPSPARIAALVLGQARRVPILAGLGALYGAYELQQGADGFMTGFAFPEVLQAMVSAARNDDQDAVFSIYERFLPLIVFEGQPGVAVRKDIFRMRGLMNSSTVRKPAASITESARTQLKDVITRVLGQTDITQPLQIA
ncbi:TPA: dihydrodipicolinate synthase family protein [Candidatus Latescibacteria bacterium]|nr:dihydrodipicolinate synthase family protein [Candidatus Latescibacterota bacterium]